MRFLILLNLFFCVYLGAQVKPDLKEFKSETDQLKAWEKYCNSLSDNEKYAELIPVAEKGIQLAKNNEIYLGSFYYLKGYGYEYTNNQFQKAADYYEKSLQLAQKTKDFHLETSNLMRLNYMYYSLKDQEKGRLNFEHIKKVADTIKDIVCKATLYGSMGEYYQDRSEYENFITYKLKAINLLVLEKNKTELRTNNIGVSYLQIADIYIDMKQYEKAIEYCNYAKPYLKKTDGIAYMYDDYIEAYVNLDDLKSAQEYYKILYKFAAGNDLLDINLSFANRVMAEFYLRKNRLQLANNYANKALYFANKSDDEEILMEANIAKGKILFEEKNYKGAIDQLNLALKSAYLYDKQAFVEINKKLSESYAALKNYEKAYEFHQIYSRTNDSLLEDTGKQSLANAEAKFQNNNKKKEIKTLSALNREHLKNIENARKERIYLFAGLALIGIIGALLFYQSRNRKKINQKLSVLNSELDKANKTKTQLFGILNHDLRSPLAGLIHFLQLQKDSPELLDDATRERLQNKTFGAAENLLVQMEDLLLWSKGQMEYFKPKKTEVSVESIFQDITDNFSFGNNVYISFENPENLQVFTDKDYLKTITRNLTNNAIKILGEVENPTILWKAVSQKDTVELIITDNGKGATPEKFRALFDENVSIGIKTGLGMHLIRDLSKAINAEISVNSVENVGTSISVLIKGIN